MNTTSHTLLIHGWGANHHVFDPLHTYISTPWHNHWWAPDLPGHGAAPFDGQFNLDDIADQLAIQINVPVNLVGWSLGGMVALSLAARYPKKVNTLCLTASLAKLLACSDYPQGLHRVSLEIMAHHFAEDYHKYMHQFLQLQMLHATASAQNNISQITATICQYGAPTALNAALLTLNHADLRPLLGSIHCPVLLLYGGRDAITPPRMGEYLHQYLPQSEWILLPQAAHVPFLSHTAEFAQVLSQFWERHK